MADTSPQELVKDGKFGVALVTMLSGAFALTMSLSWRDVIDQLSNNVIADARIFDDGFDDKGHKRNMKERRLRFKTQLASATFLTFVIPLVAYIVYKIATTIKR